MRRESIDCGLLLFTECDADKNCECSEYTDGAVLSYDKLAYEKIPSFDEGERRALTAYAEEHDAPRCFVDLSAFGYSGGKYIPKETILKSREGGRGEVIFNPITLLEESHSGRGSTVLIESIDNTKAKFELVSELGFSGISFDIARAPIRELFLFQYMFGTGAVVAGALNTF